MSALGATLTPVLEPVLGSVFDARAGGGSSSFEVLPPSGFDWPNFVPRPSIRRVGFGVAYEFDIEQFRPATTAEVWTLPTGNDTTGNGTQASPYRSLNRAITAANALPDSAVAIKVGAGLYNRLMVPGAATSNKDLVIESVNGRAIVASRYEPLAWASAGGGAYSAARSGIACVWDEADNTDLGVAKRMVVATTLAQCQSTPGSWFHDANTTIYVHTFNGRAPDAQVVVVATAGNLNITTAGKWFIKGITWEGSSSAPARVVTASAVGPLARVVFDDCDFRYGTGESGNGVTVNSIPLVVLRKCRAYNNEQDGFNWHYNAQQGYAIELECEAFQCGVADNNDNGSTNHENGRIVRVLGDYFRTRGGCVTDINTSQSWNVGCASRDSTAPAEANWKANNEARMWLDTCSSSGGTADYGTTESATIRTFQCIDEDRTEAGSNVSPYEA